MHVLTALRALADPVRWRICTALATEDLCVCHLTDDLDLSQPLVSHHLKVLREAGLVTAERAGRWTYYGLSPEGFAALRDDLDAFTAAARRRRPC